MQSFSLFLVIVLVLFQTVTTGAYKCEPDPPNNKTICRLEAVADTWLEGTDSHGYDNNVLIVAKHPWFDLKRTLIKFEDIQGCYQVIRAHMYVYFWYADRASGETVYTVPYVSRPIEVRQLLRQWNENAATSVKATSSTEWNAKYVGFDGVDAYSQVNSIQTVRNGRPHGYIEWDVTLAADNWRHGDENDGVILSASNELVNGTDLRFYSRENDENLRPYMTVVCQNAPAKLK